MDYILNKKTFEDKELCDFSSYSALFGAQTRKATVNKTYYHGVSKLHVHHKSWQKKTAKRLKDDYKMSQDIVKIKNIFQTNSFSDQVMLKKALKYVDNKVCHNYEQTENDMYEQLKNEIINLFDESLNDNIELTIINDHDFKLRTKSVPQKHTSKLENVKELKLIAKNESKDDIDKEDRPEENILSIKCELINSLHTKNETDESDREESDTRLEIEAESDINLTLKSLKLDKQVEDLQSLLTMMAISANEDVNQKNELSEICENKTVKTRVERKNSLEPIFERIGESVRIKDMVEVMNVIPLRVHINDKQKVLAIKYLERWKDYVAKKKRYATKMREHKLNSFFEKLAKKKTNASKSSTQENKARLLAKDGMYQHRYKMQKHIIALQKAKLEEQNRIIEELKYNKIIEASKQSVDSIREEVRKTYYEVDRNLKPKLKFMANELKIEIEEPSLVLHCLKVPQFLQRMEKRAREREEKHAIIRERRRQMEEERQRLKQQSEIAKAELDKEDQLKIMKELREKRKREKIENIRKKQHAERMRALNVMADLHYERYLKIKYGIRPLKKLLEIKRDNIEMARDHFGFQLMKNVFLNWMWHAEDAWFERNFKAEDFYRRKILKTALESLKKNTQEYMLKKQVAEDYYDLYVVRLAFRRFREGITVIKHENEEKCQKAVQFYQSDLLFKTLTCWRALPALNAIQREQEARKSRWRQKVLQVVPDYTPPDD